MKKKIIITLGIFIGSITFLGVLAFFVPNELSFKIANAQENFSGAEEISEKIFPKWNIIPKNNQLSLLYTEKKYTELEQKISEISGKKCSLTNEKISEFCANIFYVEGLTEYQLGKDLESKKQKKYFENAIESFTKTMIMTDENSQEHVWAKENIAFLQQKFLEKQKQENQSQNKKQEKNKSGKQDKNQKNSEKKPQNSENSDTQKGGKNEEGEKQNQKGEKKSGKKNDSSSEQKGENSEKEKGKKGEEKGDSQEGGSENSSRLPQQMQQTIEQMQKNLEEDQKNSQKGFHRSKSSAEKNAQQRQDPFDDMRNDPFFQQFFGNDHFFNQQFPERKFSNQLQNPDEKDW